MIIKIMSSIMKMGLRILFVPSKHAKWAAILYSIPPPTSYLKYISVEGGEKERWMVMNADHWSSKVPSFHTIVNRLEQNK